MHHAPNPIQSLTASQPLTQQLQIERENLQRVKTARELAMRVLGSYPDYSKATPGYVAGISEAFSQYDRDIQEQLADIAVGLCARHSYLPTVENVITLGREFLAEKARKQDFDKRFSGRKVYDIDQPRITARPFPRLWAAIGPTADADFRGMEFDLIADIAKTQHLKGEDAARRQLQSLKAEHKRRAA